MSYNIFVVTKYGIHYYDTDSAGEEYMIEFAPRSKNKLSYDEALLYCQFLDYDGHTDWRMPTKEEYHNNSIIIPTNWHADDPSGGDRKWRVVPVRDVCLK